MYMADRLTEEMKVMSLCQEMHWTYDDYMAQPEWFIELLYQKLRIDGAKATREIKKIK